MNKSFAKIISTVLNPLAVLAILPFILVFKTTGSVAVSVFWTLFSGIFLLITTVFVFIGIEKGYFTDLDISRRSQRPLLYTFAILLSIVYAIFLYILKAPEILFIALCGLVFGLFCMEVVNRITKASIHVATISAFATGITLGFGPIFILSFLLIPLVGWARIKTHNHTKRQTVIGSLMGILITLMIYVIFKYIV